MVDLTGVASATIAGVFTILSVIIPILVQKYIKDKQAAEIVSTAIENSLGAIQQEAQKVVTSPPKVSFPGVPNHLAPGVSYVLDHAGEEAKRLNLSSASIADKISAKIGLASIQTNIAIASSPGPVPQPLDPVVPSVTIPFVRKPL